MDRNVRPRRAFPEDMEETDQHPWLLVEAAPQPDNFEEDYVVLSVLVGTLLARLLPGVEIPFAYGAIGFAVKRTRLSAVTILHIKKIICELVWARSRQEVNLSELQLISDLNPWPRMGAPMQTWMVTNNLNLNDVRQGNPQPRRNLGSSWPVFVLGREDQQYLDPYEKIESPAVYMARPGVEIQFLTTQLNPVLIPRSGLRSVSRSSWQSH